MSDYKLKLIDTIEQALDEMDKLGTKEEKGAMATWFSDFALEAASAVMAYAQLTSDMRPIVRQGLKDKHSKVRKHLAKGT
jgi:hypothetical protein